VAVAGQKIYPLLNAAHFFEEIVDKSIVHGKHGIGQSVYQNPAYKIGQGGNSLNGPPVHAGMYFRQKNGKDKGRNRPS
jgi:hypothetical protein